MTLEAAKYITQLCTTHELTRPTIHNQTGGSFHLQWKLPDGSITLTNYDAAFHFMRCLYIESRSVPVEEKGRSRAFSQSRH